MNVKHLDVVDNGEPLKGSEEHPGRPSLLDSAPGGWSEPLRAPSPAPQEAEA